MNDIEDLIATVQRHGYANERAEAEAVGQEALTAINALRAEGGEAVAAADLYEARLLNILAIVAVIHGDHATAVELADRVLTIAEHRGALQEQAMALGTFGIVYDDLTDYPKALEYQERALKINETIGDENGITRCFGNLGSIYYKLEQYDRAMDYFQKVYDHAILQRDDVPSAQYDKQLAGVLSNIGGVHYSKGDDTQALSYYEQALTLNEAGGDAYFTAINLSNIGGVYARAKDVAKATEYYQRAIAVSESIGYTTMVASSLTLLGELIDDVAMLERVVTYGTLRSLASVGHQR